MSKSKAITIKSHRVFPYGVRFNVQDDGERFDVYYYQHADKLHCTVCDSRTCKHVKAVQHDEKAQRYVSDTAPKCSCPAPTRRGGMRFAPRAVDCPIHGER